jgi:hypothetical protein
VHPLRTMFAGCFSWCPLRMCGAKKQSTSETKPLEVSTNSCCAILLTHCCVQKLPEIPLATKTDDEVRRSIHAHGFRAETLSGALYKPRLIWEVCNRTNYRRVVRAGDDFTRKLFCLKERPIAQYCQPTYRDHRLPDHLEPP